MRWMIGMLVVAAACDCGEAGSRDVEGAGLPLSQAILGAWEIQCRTDDPRTSTCIGREQTVFIKTFQPDGTLVSQVVGGMSQTGHWTLNGSQLEMAFTGGGMRVREEHTARIEDGKLILWSGRFGAIYGRRGEAFEPAATVESSGSGEARDLGQVRYTLDVPSGYRLGRDDNDRQRWEPISGDGLTYRITVSPRAQRLDGEQWVTPPCPPEDRPLYAGVGSIERDGASRNESVSTAVCVTEPDVSVGCVARHTRGWIEDHELPEAQRVCQSLSAAPR